MAKNKFLIISLNLNPEYVSLPLLYLKKTIENSSCLKSNYEIKCLNFDIHTSSQKVTRAILNENPDIVGFSTYIWNYEKTLTTCTALKETENSIKIILGGSYVSVRARDTFKKVPEIDFIVKDEAIITIQELLEYFSKGNNIANIDGLVYKTDGEIIETSPREKIKNLDKIPSPYQGGKQEEFKNSVIRLETQRGCPYNCSYCYWALNSRGITYFSLDRVKNDLKYLLDCPARTVYFLDALFTSKVKRAKEICRFISKHNKHRTKFIANISGYRIDEELARLLKEANIQVGVGLQSASEYVLNGVNRKFDRDKFEAGYSLLKKYDVTIQLHLIIGLPDATLESIENSIKYGLQLEPDILSTFPLEILPGTPLWKNADDMSLKFDSEPFHAAIETKNIPAKELREIYKTGYAVSILYSEYPLEKIGITTPDELLDIAKLWLDNSSYWKKLGKNNYNDFFGLGEKEMVDDFKIFLEKDLSK